MTCEREEDIDLEQTNCNTTPKTRQTGMKLPTFAAVCGRHNISDRVGAELASAGLYDFATYFDIDIPT